MTARFGFPLLNIRWQEVLDVLHGMLPNDAVHAGHWLVGFTQGEEEKEGGGGAEGSGSVKCVFKEVSGGEERLLEVEGWDAVEQLVNATSPELIRESRALDLPPLPFWVHGRVALMGGMAGVMTCRLACHVMCGFDALSSFESIRMSRVQAVSAQNTAQTKKVFDKEKEGKEGKEKNAAGSDEREAEAAPKIEEVQAASATVAAREGRDPDEELYGYDTVVLE
ncbi:unnamed protein product [Closterium sp. NIES-54]